MSGRPRTVHTLLSTGQCPGLTPAGNHDDAAHNCHPQAGWGTESERGKKLVSSDQFIRTTEERTRGNTNTTNKYNNINKLIHNAIAHRL